jgi:hypothetical protein|tara:strand:+ start:672 stop:914 length:243 start_codon:yes stop_codon:yes gene_type:complete
MVTVLVSMVVMTWQHGKNRALTQLLENNKVQDATHLDRIFDLVQENADLMECVMTLETDNSILSSCCEGGGMAVDTNSIY